MTNMRIILITLFWLCALSGSMAKNRMGILEKTFAYGRRMDTCCMTEREEYAYTKYSISTERRNPILLAVPTMYAIAHSGERTHIGETYDKTVIDSMGNMTASRLLQLTTIPHNKTAMTTLLKYLTPNVYGTTIIGNSILSPFHRHNRRYYRYTVSQMADGTASIIFKPKVRSAQFIAGYAVVDAATGRIVRTCFDGEYDMIKFFLELDMNDSGKLSLYPKSCRLEARFKFMGNRITSRYMAMYGLHKGLPDSTAVHTQHDMADMDSVRPLPLTTDELAMVSRRVAQTEDTASEKRRSSFAAFLWDNIGENLIGRIKSDFGHNKQGYVRISPILNPLYFGYSGRQGITYKFDVRANYSFSDNSNIAMRVKAGYSFKQHLFYFNIPTVFYFNRKRNGFIEMEFGNGNRITNSEVAQKLKEQSQDSVIWSKMGLEYFKDMSYKLNAHYDLSDKFGIQAGMVLHRRTAIDKQSFVTSGMSPHFVSAAPTIELQFRPTGYSGPVITANYERSIKGFMTANIGYERYEFDAQYRHALKSLSSLQMRIGTGFYTNKGKDWYFLDYSNFHEENIIGGWNDNWTNDFELLNSNWYNASRYYVRANVTYESPVIAIAWIPFIGRFIEKERIYINTLDVTRLHPYIEYGYGIATHILSAGMFVGQKNGRFDGFGVRFGFELFRQW